MKILATSGWEAYELLDTGNGFRLERFGPYRLVRPDPQVIWKPTLKQNEWDAADAVFDVNEKRWVIRKKMPERWLLQWENLSFWAELTPFKHTGIFPEQIIQWEWIETKVKNQMSKVKNENQKLKVLNLFGYTGIASLVCAQAGAAVTHVDASKPTIGWARENQTASHLSDKPIRWILDDALKFTEREIKRGVKYDGIIMDPPVYGHGPHGETWDFTHSFPKLLDVCKEVLSDKPIFVLINAYAISASSLMLENILKDFTQGMGGEIEAGELALQEKSAGRLLSTGIFGRWTTKT